MGEENSNKTASLIEEKSLSPSSSSIENKEEKQQQDSQLSSVQTPQQIGPSSFPAFSGEQLSQMSLYPPRYYYQYYMPHAAFGAYGLYGNVPATEGKLKYVQSQKIHKNCNINSRSLQIRLHQLSTVEVFIS